MQEVSFINFLFLSLPVSMPQIDVKARTLYEWLANFFFFFFFFVCVYPNFNRLMSDFSQLFII